MGRNWLGSRVGAGQRGQEEDEQGLRDPSGTGVQSPTGQGPLSGSGRVPRLRCPPRPGVCPEPKHTGDKGQVCVGTWEREAQVSRGRRAVGLFRANGGRVREGVAKGKG